MPSLRRPATALTAAALLLLAPACSSDDGDGGNDGGPSGSAGEAVTTTRTAPPPTVDPEVLARPEVRAADAWAAAYARSVNEGDRTFAAAADLVAPAVQEWMGRHAGLEWGRYFPGPLPVAPLVVRPDGTDHRDVDACVMVSGWTQESRSVRRTRSREVVGMTIRMASTGSRWRVDRITSLAVDCSGVVPRTRRW